MHAAEYRDPYDPDTGWTRPAPTPPSRRRRGPRWTDLAFWGILGVLATAGLFGLSVLLGLWPEPETSASSCQTELDAPRIYVADAGAGETAVARISEQLRSRGVIVVGAAEAPATENGTTSILSGRDSGPTAKALATWFPRARTVDDGRDGFIATLALGEKGNKISSDMTVGPATEACTD